MDKKKTSTIPLRKETVRVTLKAQPVDAEPKLEPTPPSILQLVSPPPPPEPTIEIAEPALKLVEPEPVARLEIGKTNSLENKKRRPKLDVVETVLASLALLGSIIILGIQLSIMSMY